MLQSPGDYLLTIGSKAGIEKAGLEAERIKETGK